MSNAIKPPSENKDFAPIPAANHVARCVRVVDLGTQTVPKFGVPGVTEQKEQVMLIFEFPFQTIVNKDGVEMPMLQSKTYTKSMHENAGLRIDLKSWRAKDYTADELQVFNLNNVCGHPCLITIIHKPSKDGTKTFANIDAITQVPQGMSCPAAAHAPFTYEIEEGVGGHFSELPDWIQERILKAAEWQAAPTEATPEPAPSPVGTVVVPANQGVPAPALDTVVPDSDLPF